MQAESLFAWQDMGLYGGQVLSLAVDPSNPTTIYAGTWGGDGLFKSSDGGIFWSILPSTAPARFRNCEVFDIAIDPDDSDTLWVADKQQIDISTDGGATWRTAAPADNRFVYCIAVDPHDPTGRTVYAGTSGPYGTEQLGALYKTQDAGATWILMLAAPHDILDVVVSPSATDEVWAVSAPWSESPGRTGRVYHSLDAGRTWSFQTAARLPDGGMQRFGYLDEIAVTDGEQPLVFAGGAQGIVRIETGEPFSETHWAMLLQNSIVNALCVPAASPAVLYASSSEGFHISRDQGTVWRTIAPAPLFLCLQADPREASILYGGSVNQGVFKTEDSGASWVQRQDGLLANTVYAVAISPTDPTHIACATLAGLFTKNNGSWRCVNSRSCYAVVYHPHNDSVIYAGFDNMIGKSTDSGATWRCVTVGNPKLPHDITAIAVAPDEPQTIFAAVGYDAGDRGAIVRISDNGGDFSRSTWTVPLSANIPVNTIAIHPRQQQIILAGTGWFYAPGVPGCLYKSSDGGLSWTAGSLRNVVVNSIAFAPSEPDTVYAACGESGNRWAGIFKSTDTGATWSPAVNGLPAPFSAADIAVDPVAPGTIYAALYDAAPYSTVPLGGVYATFDAGAYWTQIGLSDYALHCVGLIPHTASTAVFARQGFFNNAHNAAIVAGTESGLFSTTTAGTGLLTGSIVSADSDLPITGAIVESDLGLHCISSAGYYCLMLPSGTHSLRITAQGYQAATVPAVTVHAGASVEQNIVMTPTAADGSSPCLVERLLNSAEDRHALDTLRILRDHVLATTPGGRWIITLYGDLQSDVQKVLLSNPTLTVRCRALLIKAAAVFGTGSAPSASQILSLFNEACGILHAVEHNASEPLRHRLHRAQSKLTTGFLPESLVPAPDERKRY